MTRVATTTKTLIVNERGELLVLRIGEHTKQPWRSNSWDLPGGFVDDADTSERDGALREVREETGIELSMSDLSVSYGLTRYYKENDIAVTHMTYLVTLDHTPEVKISWEHEGFEWSDFRTILDKYEFPSHYEQAIQHTLDRVYIDNTQQK